MATKKTKRKSMRRAVKGKRETSDRVSRIAAKVMAEFDWPKSVPVFVMGFPSGVTVGDVLALAASALSQDETKGKRTR